MHPMATMAGGIPGEQHCSFPGAPLCCRDSQFAGCWAASAGTLPNFIRQCVNGLLQKRYVRCRIWMCWLVCFFLLHTVVVFNAVAAAIDHIAVCCHHHQMKVFALQPTA